MSCWGSTVSRGTPRFLEEEGDVGGAELDGGGGPFEEPLGELEVGLALGVGDSALGAALLAGPVDGLLGPQDLGRGAGGVEAAPDPGEVFFGQADTGLALGGGERFGRGSRLGARLEGGAVREQLDLTRDDAKLPLGEERLLRHGAHVPDRSSHVRVLRHPHDGGELALRLLGPGSDGPQLALRLRQTRHEVLRRPARDHLAHEARLGRQDVALDRPEGLPGLAQAVADAEVLARAVAQPQPRRFELRPHRPEVGRHGLEATARHQQRVGHGREGRPRLDEKGGLGRE